MYIYLIFFKWIIVSLEKTLIHPLVSFIALWSCIETVILIFNHLESIEVHYMEIREMFSSKTLISFRLKKEIHKTSWMTLGWVNYKEMLIWKWTNPLKHRFKIYFKAKLFKCVMKQSWNYFKYTKVAFYFINITLSVSTVFLNVLLKCL